MQEYMSSGDVALARRNADDTAAMKRSRDEYWRQAAGVVISPPPATRQFFKLEEDQRKLIATVTPELLIEQYRACDGLPPNAVQKDVLRWFHTHAVADHFPVMLAIARCCVFIPSTSAPAERVASTAGQVYNKRRLSLHEALAETIVVLHESRRWLAQRIIDISPLVIQQLVREALHRAGAFSGDEHSSSDSEGSYGSSDGN
jgi:hypothetical protein